MQQSRKNLVRSTFTPKKTVEYESAGGNQIFDQHHLKMNLMFVNII